MTFKKSMISISAAAILAAGLTGCGSSDTTPTPTKTTTEPTTSGVKVVNSYMVDANVTAWEVNATGGSEMVATYTYNSADKTYEPNATVEFDYVLAQPKASGTYVDYAPYGDYNSSSEDVNASSASSQYTFRMLKGNSIITPVTELAYEMIDVTELNGSNAAALEGNLTLAANAMGISLAEMNADPISGTTSYTAIERAARGILTLGTTAKAAAIASLKTAGATKAASFEAAMDNLVAAANAANASTLKDTYTAIKALGADTAATANIAKAVTSGGAIEFLTGAGEASYYITDGGKVYLNSDGAQTAADAVDGLAGHKVAKGNDAIVSFFMEKASSDINVTGKTVDIAMKARYVGDSANDANTTSTKVTVKGVTLTNPQNNILGFDVNSSTLVDYTVVTDEGDTVTASDVNFSVLGLASTDIDQGVTVTNMNNINVGNIIMAVNKKVEGDHNLSSDTDNLTNAYGYQSATSFVAGSVNNIWDMDVAIITETNTSVSKKSTSGSTYYPLSASTCGGYALVDNIVDQRGGEDGVNTAPNTDDNAYTSIAVSSSNGATVTNNIAASEGFVLDINSTSQESNVTFGVTSDDQDNDSEMFTSYVASLASTAYNTTTGFVTLLTDTNATSTGGTATNTADGVTHLRFKVSATTALAGMPTGSHPEQNITVTATDEFGKLEPTGSSALTVTLNRAPSAPTWGTAAGDINISKVADGTEVQSLSAAVGDSTTDPIIYKQDSGAATIDTVDGVTVTSAVANSNLNGFAATDLDGDVIGSWAIVGCAINAESSTQVANSAITCTISADSAENNVKIATTNLNPAFTVAITAEGNLTTTMTDLGASADFSNGDHADFNITFSAIDSLGHYDAGNSITKSFRIDSAE